MTQNEEKKKGWGLNLNKLLKCNYLNRKIFIHKNI